MPVRTSSSTRLPSTSSRARSHGSIANDAADSLRQPEATSIRGSRRSSSCSRSSPIPPGRSNARGRVLSSAQPGGRRSRSALPARHIEAAIATFDQLGAVLWAEKANSELRRISGRRAPSEALTETEHRVASLAAEGQTNKEIAAALYMGASTVEAHLSRVYRKLGIRSRVGLKDALAVDAAAVNTRDGAAQP